MNINAQLQPRQMEVAEYIAFGYSIKETADDLNISVETVKVHMKNIYRLIGIQKATELSVFIFCRKFNIPLSMCHPAKRIIAMLLLMLFSYSMYVDNSSNYLRRARRCERIERVIRREM